MTEDVLAARERADAFVLLDLHQHRRASGIATVSTLIGGSLAESRAVAFAWAAERSMPVVRAGGEAGEIVERWFASTFLRPGMRAATVSLLAERLGCAEREALNRHRENPRIVVDALRSVDGETAAAVIAAGAGDVTIPSAWERVLGRSPSEEHVLRIVRTVADLYGPGVMPALLLSPELEGTDTLRRAEWAVRLVEATPALCVLTAATEAMRPLLLARTHASDLIAEGAIYLGIPRDRFLDDPEVARAIADAETARGRAVRSEPSDDALDRARSAAERALALLLDRHPVTHGRFELNATISATFGNRAAEIDLLDARARIALEVDGYHHFRDAEAYRRDRRKDAMLQAEGYLVLRTLADDVVDRPRDVVRHIVHAVQQRDLRGG